MQRFKKIAQEQLGLDDTEALCYELLLIKGKLTTGEVCGYAKLQDYEKVKAILEDFVTKGLAQKIPMAKGLVDVYVGTSPFEGIVNNLEEISVEMGKWKKEIDDSLQKLKDETKQELSNVRTNVETIINDEKGTITDSVSKANDNTTQTVETSTSEHTNFLNEYKQNVESSTTATKEGVKTNIETFKTESETSTAKFKDDSTAKANKTKDTIVSGFEGLDKKVKELFIQAKEQFSTTITSAKDKSIADNKSQQDQSLERINIWKGKTFTELDGLSKSTGEKLDESLNNLKTKNSKNVTSLKENLNTQSDTFRTNLDTNITANRDILSEALVMLSEQTSTNLTKLQDDLSGALEQGKSALDSTLETQKNDLNAYLTEKITDINSNFTNQVTDLDSGMNTHKESFNTTLDDQLNKFMEFGKIFFSETKDQFAEKVQSVINFVTERFKEYEAQTQTQFNTLKGEVETKFKGFSDNVSSDITKLKEGTLSNMNSVKEEIKSKSTEFNEELKTIQVSMIEDLGNTLAENNTNFSNQLDSDLTEIESEVETISNNTKANIEKINSDSKSTINGDYTLLSNDYGTLATTFDEKVTGDVNNAITDMNTKSDEVEALISKPFEEGSKLTSEHYANFNNELNVFSDSLVEQSKTTANSNQTKVDEDLDSLKNVSIETGEKTVESYISSINKLKDALMGEIKALDDSFTGSIDKIGTESLSSIDTLLNNMLGSFDTAVMGVKGPLDKVVESANKNKATFAGVWDDVKTMELLKAEGTWLIVTQHTIMAYLAALVKRTKLHFLIVVPSLDLLPIDAILQTKASQKITIASKITDKALANKLIEKSNVDLREITEMSVSVMGANRDQEEAFYGPVTKNPNEMVCTITQQDELIQLIAEMLSWFYRGRSKKFTG